MNAIGFRNREIAGEIITTGLYDDHFVARSTWRMHRINRNTRLDLVERFHRRRGRAGRRERTLSEDRHGAGKKKAQVSAPERGVFISEIGSYIFRSLLYALLPLGTRRLHLKTAALAFLDNFPAA